ncbi:MAG: ABC transporter permease [Acidobacteriia bacterium]|nr:ABC transporter permease [Terriglobia bacterium]
MFARVRTFLSKLGGLLAARRSDREFEDEIRTHLSLLAERFVRQGMTPEKARHAARRQFGNFTLVKEVRHEMRTFAPLATFFQDAAYGARLLRNNPGFTVVALLTLAVGIGANTAVFSMVRGILMKPLPYPEAERLVVPATIFPRYNTDRGAVAFADILDWKAERGVFEAVAAMSSGDADLTGGEQPERVPGALADEDYFRVMGIAPLAGRFFSPEDNLPGAPKVVVLAHRFWMRRFGGDPGAVGSRIEIGGAPHLVIGVARPEAIWPEDAEMVRPLGMGGPRDANMLRRDNHTLRAIARLKRGVPLGEAQARLTIMGARVAERETNRAGTNWKLHPLAGYIVGSTLRRTLLVLFGAVLLVLLIACVNVANVLLARGAAREREVAVRAALGAGWKRLAAQFLAESALLAAGGGLLGVLAGYAGLKALVRLAPPDVPRLAEVKMDWTVLAFTAGLALASAVLAGLAPAARAARLAPGQFLHEAGRSVSAGARGAALRRLLVVTEVALAIVLLTGAGLLIRSFGRIQQVEPGFQSRSLLAMEILLPRYRYPGEAQIGPAFEQMAERIRDVPGVVSCAAVSSLPAGGGGFYLGRVFLREGQPEPPVSADARAAWSVVQPGYFQTMGIPMLRGREFSARDIKGAVPVIVVSESLAREMFPHENPLGRRIRSWRDENLYREIVGVAADVRYYGLTERMPNNVYVPHRQNTWRTMVLATRVAGEPGAMEKSIRRAIWSQDNKVSIAWARTMDGILQAQLARPRFSMFLLGILGAAALLLAGVGIYGVLACSVAQRRREIGIRMALGAGRSAVLRMIARQTLGLAGAGAACGVAGALALTGLMQALLYEVSPRDARAFLLASALLVGVALAAGLIPARRASRVGTRR